MRGRGLPGCARGVTVPTSMKPKPSAASPSMHAPSLSRPAASPTGIAESEAHDGARRIGHALCEHAGEPGAAGGAEHAQRQVVGVFRIHAKELGAGERIKGTEHEDEAGDGEN